MIPSIPIAQAVGQSDSDVIFIDMEHAPQPIEVVTQMVHAFASSSRGKGFPLIRIPSHGVEWVSKLMDKKSRHLSETSRQRRLFKTYADPGTLCFR